MENNTVNTDLENESLTTETQEQSDRKTYRTPKLHRYGGLTELVQRRSNRAMDGAAIVDCTLT